MVLLRRFKSSKSSTVIPHTHARCDLSATALFPYITSAVNKLTHGAARSVMRVLILHYIISSMRVYIIYCTLTKKDRTRLWHFIIKQHFVTLVLGGRVFGFISSARYLNTFIRSKCVRVHFQPDSGGERGPFATGVSFRCIQPGTRLSEEL